jgi:hypothetical protein
MSTQQTQQGCDACNKSGLSLLLVRPSPIANHSDLQAPGSANAVADGALVNPFIPAGLTESRPVLRLLREGFVHLYIPSKGLWRTWRVTDRADVLEQNHPLFATPSVDASCCRKGHNASGFKLIHIPQAHELMGQSIWLAFSANRWSDRLKGQNKANPKAMVEVKLGSANAPAFKPDAQSLKRQLLECNVGTWRLPKVDDGLQPLFPFSSLNSDDEVQHLAETLKNAAAVHPKTLGHELAVVLPDPVGYAAELNALRLIAEKRGLQLPVEDQHKLQSHFVLKGLVDNVADMRAMDTWAPVIPKREFDRITRHPSMKGRWVSLDGTVTVESGGSTAQSVRADAMGRYWMEGREEMLAQKLPEFQAKAKKEIEKGYNPTVSQDWVNALEVKTRKALEPYERQWLAARDHATVAQYFALHFDDAEPNRPSTLQPHSAGGSYIRESAHIDGPPPKTSVALLDAYMAAYYKKPEDPQAFAVRAMVANQKELFMELSSQLAGDPNGEGMRDKTVDFIKGLLEVKGEHFRVKYSWLTEATMSFALFPMNNLAAASGAFLALEGADGLRARPRVAALAMNAAAWFGGMNTALKSAMGQRVVRPVLVSFWLEQGMVNRAILGPKGEFHGWMGARQGGRQLVTVLTDTERLSKGPLDVQALLSGADGTEVARGKKAGTALAAQASGAIVINAATGLTAQQGSALFAQQVEEARKIGGTIRAAIPQGAKAMTMSIDGRLALASVIVQTIGIINGTKAVSKAEAELKTATSEAERAKKEKALRDAKLGYMDSVGGLVAGSLDSVRVAGEAMNLQRGAAAEATALNSIHALKFGAQVAGVFGGFLNGYVSRLKFDEAKERGLDGVAQAHFVASRAFYGTGFTALTGAGLFGAEFVVKRQLGSAAVQQAAGRFVAARVGGVAVGAAVPVAGWVLLALGIVASVGAALLEPTELEAWARQTPFGKGPNGQKFKTLEEQDKGLYKALDLAAQVTPTEVKAA